MFKPGKGAHLILNEKVLTFIRTALAELDEVGFNDDMADGDEKVLLDALEEKGWKKSKDKFGDKRYRVIGHGEDQLRVTVVFTSRDEFKLDIRLWYDDEV